MESPQLHKYNRMPVPPALAKIVKAAVRHVPQPPRRRSFDWLRSLVGGNDGRPSGH
jgi:hypothetical protein